MEHYKLLDYPKTDEVFNYLFVGRIMEEKGVEELFSAMQMLVADGYKCVLSILGAYEENYKDRIDSYINAGWLKYYGYQLDVRPYIYNCHCFVLPSWHEGMANTNLECAASGRPVITSNIPGCKEAVIDGTSGFVVNPRDKNDLYKKMKRMIELNQETRVGMGVAGRKHMEANFDKIKVVSRTISRIEEANSYGRS